jgi:hypothetical protein
MIVVGHKLDGKWAAPKHHPITCANPAPWRIIAADIDHRGRVMIRGEGSMWFPYCDCWVEDSKEELDDFIEIKRVADTLDSICRSVIINPTRPDWG